MLNNGVIEQLKKIVGGEGVLTTKSDLVTYSYDSTADMPRQLPEVVVLPRTTEEVQQIVKLAGEKQLAIYSRGAGTNLSGGTIPIKQGIVLSFQKMNKILEFDNENLTVTVQPGVIIQEVNNLVASHGLIYPPDPGTVATATMGGSVAECSGGLRGLKYGVTKDYVMAMEVVLANGDIVRFGGKTVKNVTGYDFASLFVGSEGTLGIITEVTVKVIPAPKYRRSLLALFANLGDAGNTVTEIVKAHVIPATLEIMDNETIRTVENYSKIGLQLDVEAMLLIEVDGMTAELVEAEAQVVQRVVKENHGSIQVANSDAERDNLWAARRAALPSLAQVSPTTVLEDATVPRNKVKEMLVAVQEVAARNKVRIGTFGHAGDGNLHPTILADAGNQEEMARVHKSVDEIFAVALSLGGTLSGEHGIGMAKMKYLSDELGKTGFDLIKTIKAAFDPHNILNPGKMVP